jgi:hypothetical protein
VKLIPDVVCAWSLVKLVLKLVSRLLLLMLLLLLTFYDDRKLYRKLSQEQDDKPLVLQEHRYDHLLFG